MTYIVVAGYRHYGLFLSMEAARTWGMNALKDAPWHIVGVERVV